MQISQMKHQPAIEWGGKACLKFIFALFGQFHHVSKVFYWGAAASRFVICQDCWQEISLCGLSEATNSDAHMT